MPAVFTKTHKGELAPTLSSITGNLAGRAADIRRYVAPSEGWRGCENIYLNA